MKAKRYSMSAPVCIAQALIAMMEHTPIEDIHIKDLIKKAGVSRMSYYRYFSGKTDVLKFYLDYVLDALNRYTERQSGFVQGDVEKAYPLYYYAGAIFNVYMQWILHGAKETPEEVARLVTG
ncbi:MAG: TetR/AcrR family transcriptional regulator [Lachnospiraceae bacterium]|nr:TetR/AcrR family transcriptional regulator [Lachnospiraceae bacterium]